MARINDDVLSVLSEVYVHGMQVKMPPLDRKLYVSVNKVLEALGGKWDRYAKAHVFETNPAPLLDACMLTGTYDKPSDFDFFETPFDLAFALVEAAGIRSDSQCLEPSAGRGALYAHMPKARTTVYEIQPDRAACLDVPPTDFLTVVPDPKYDCIVMNPPFSREQDMQHILHAFEFLKEGGRLVAVAGAGVAFRQTKRAVAFRELVDQHGEIEPLPEGSFKSSGTMVNTVKVTLER